MSEKEARGGRLDALFAPRAIAVVGASDRDGSIGGRILRNLIDGGFRGAVYPVNRNRSFVHSVLAYPFLERCPDPVDLAILAVPAAAVPGVAREAERKGVRALVVIAAGFAEASPSGARLQEELLEICRRSGMRLVGPNCMGIVNTDPTVRMNAQFAPVAPAPGSIAFLSQSGALGIAVLDQAARTGLGVSSFVSVGNKADVSGNDLLEQWEAEERTRVILMYLESFGNPRKFAQIARRVSRRKPIVVVKGGRSAAGFRATQSHTGALVRAADVTVDGLFMQTGVIRTDTVSEMLDVAALLAAQPVPGGKRVAIVSNGGGLGILAADACENGGLVVPELAPATQQALGAFLPAGAAVRNPVDLIASASAADYARAMSAVLAGGEIDALLVVFIPPVASAPADVVRAIEDAARAAGPILVMAVMLAGETTTRTLPSYATPESAARALAKAAEYGAWLGSTPGRVRAFPDVDRGEARAVVERAIASGAGWLPPGEIACIASAYGLPLVATRHARTPAEAGRAAESLGGKVALKCEAEGLIHKSEQGAVRLGLAGAAEIEAAAREIGARLRAAGLEPRAFLVQPMVTAGVEILAGITHDPIFGPVVVCAGGGVLVELYRDVAVRPAPLTDRDAHEMVRSLRTAALLEGYRGGPRHEIAALEELLLRISALAEDLPGVAELDLNPVKVLPEGEGLSVLDARIRVAPQEVL